MKNLKYLLFLLIFSKTFTLDLFIPKAPPAIPTIKVSQEIKEIKIHYYTNTVTEAVPKIMQNKEYLYIIPTNLAAKLKNKGKDLQLLGIISSGILSVISTENTESINELNGKNIYVGGQGSSPDVITQYILNKNNINSMLKYRSSPEIAKLIISEKVDYAVLPEPLATFTLFKNKNLKRIFIFKNEWEKLNNENGIPQVGFFASKKFIKDNENEIKIFLNEYEKSVKWVNNNPLKAAFLGKNKLMLPMPEEIIENSIPNMNLIYLSSKDSKDSVNLYLNNLMQINKKIISKLPKDDFYEN